ncbi:MAG TPA: hypothetical protein VK424_00450 [Thermoplasmata archaeon]|nr:hypothetical protein [Thermoplasmata archaeon]
MSAMHSFVDLYFAPEGVSPLEISERLRKTAGLSFIIGPHDLAFEWGTVEEFQAMLHKVHEALRGTGVFYRVETVTEDPAYIEPIPWPPPITRSRTHPGY